MKTLKQEINSTIENKIKSFKEMVIDYGYEFAAKQTIDSTCYNAVVDYVRNYKQ